MKPTIRLALIAVSCLAIQADVFVTAASSVPSACPLTVHEWGTFTSVAGDDGSAVDWDALGCKDDLPSFVNDFGYRGFKWRVSGTVRMETPVIYFYADEPMDARVKVAFPRGLITEWYPRADYQVFQSNGPANGLRRLEPNLNGIDTSLINVTGGMEWRHIRVEPNTTPSFPTEGNGSRYYAARQTDASPISVDGQHEKFLFYRGVGRFAVPLSARVDENGKLLVENPTDAAVPFSLYFENRNGRLRYRNLGVVRAPMAADLPTSDNSFAQLRHELEAALVSQGLFPKEASAMVETWKDSWFEEGARVIYIVPSQSVDKILPLEIEPRPSQVTRVFVGRIELFTPETLGVVKQAASNRDKAVLDRYGRFLSAILKRIESQPGADPSAVRQLQVAVAGRRCS